MSGQRNMKVVSRETTLHQAYFARAERLRERSSSWSTEARLDAVRRLIWSFYRSHGRAFPWRTTTNPYRILVSEVMLQQTQTSRVVPKYAEWMRELPTVRSLAEAPLPKVLGLWQGLGYNRRAVALRNAARMVVEDFGGRVPCEVKELLSLPGVGAYTANAVCAFSANQKAVLIETNIRTVVLYFFFAGCQQVHDREIEPIVERLCPPRRSREWYYAMMDFGVCMKRFIVSSNAQSLHYRKQSRFDGSRRQLRGKVVRELLGREVGSLSALAKRLGCSLPEVRVVVDALAQEGILKVGRKGISLAEGVG